MFKLLRKCTAQIGGFWHLLNAVCKCQSLCWKLCCIFLVWQCGSLDILLSAWLTLCDCWEVTRCLPMTLSRVYSFEFLVFLYFISTVAYKRYCAEDKVYRQKYNSDHCRHYCAYFKRLLCCTLLMFFSDKKYSTSRDKDSPSPEEYTHEPRGRHP